MNGNMWSGVIYALESHALIKCSCNLASPACSTMFRDLMSTQATQQRYLLGPTLKKPPLSYIATTIKAQNTHRVDLLQLHTKFRLMLINSSIGAAG